MLPEIFKKKNMLIAIGVPLNAAYPTRTFAAFIYF